MMNFLAKIILKSLRHAALTNLAKHRGAQIGSNFQTGDYCNFKIYPDAKSAVIGPGVSIRNYCSILVGKDAQLKISDRVFMNNYCSINCLQSIEIGENTLFGEGVRLYDHNHEYGFHPEFKVEHQKFNTAPIKIGKNCWLGSNVTVLKGVTIGDNCIIGAHCLIYKDVPANSIVKNKTELETEEIKK